MAFQRVPNTIVLQVRATLGGELVENGFFYQKASTPLQADVDAAVSNASNWWETFWQPAMSGDYVVREFFARSLDSEIAVQAVDDSDAGEFGDLGSACPGNVSLAVARKSGFTGRGARGRIFIAGVPENQVDATMRTNTTYTGLITDALVGLDTLMAADSLFPVIVHRVSGGVPLVPAVVLPLLTWIVTDLIVDSQRNRLPGH